MLTKTKETVQDSLRYAKTYTETYGTSTEWVMVQKDLLLNRIQVGQNLELDGDEASGATVYTEFNIPNSVIVTINNQIRKLVFNPTTNLTIIDNAESTLADQNIEIGLTSSDNITITVFYQTGTFVSSDD